jgi:hypothetical protein
MAIFVSNTAAPVFAPPLSEGTDPNLPGLESAFTEELAAVRRPLEADADPAVSAPSLKEDEKDEDTGGLQILPANVLINAVTDANFAYALQGQVVQPVVPVDVAVTPEVPVDTSATAQAVGEVGTFGVANVSGSAGQAVQALANPELNGVSPVKENEPAAKFENVAPQAFNPSDLKTQVSDGPADAASAKAKQPLIQEPVKNFDQADDSVALEALKAAQVDQASQAVQVAQATQSTQASQATQALQSPQKTSVDATRPMAIESPQTADALSTVSIARPDDQIPVHLTSAPSDTNTALKVLANTPNVSEVASDNPKEFAQASSLANSEIPSTQPQPKLAAAAVQTIASPVALATSVQAATPLGATLGAATKKSADTTATHDVHASESSSLPFDAHLGSGHVASEANATIEAHAAKDSAPSGVNINAVGMAVPKGSTDAVSLAANLASEPSFETVQKQAKIDLVSSQLVQDQTETTSSAPKSFEDLSSSFVSSLVGGAPRPMATMMDMTALQSQDKTTPVTPHEARLDAGAIHMEIQRMVKQGGGHVVMEITPPDQSKFTIELKMDNQGNARLMVEGVSDSTRTRLEQSAPQLREQFQQMGMELQLDMRQQRDNGSQGSLNQDGPSDRTSLMPQQPDIKLPVQRASAASRALASGANQVYLYA